MRYCNKGNECDKFSHFLARTRTWELTPYLISWFESRVIHFLIDTYPTISHALSHYLATGVKCPSLSYFASAATPLEECHSHVPVHKDDLLKNV